MNIVYELLDITAVVIEVVMCFIFVASFIEEDILRKHITGIVVVNILNIALNYIAVYSVFKFVLYIGTMILSQLLFYHKYYDRIIVMSIAYTLFLALADYSTVAVMTYLSEVQFGYFQEITLFRICGTIISKSILLIFVFFIRKRMNVLKKLKRNHLFFLFAISAIILIFAIYMFQSFLRRNNILGSEVMIFMLLLLIEVLFFYSFAFITENNQKEEKLNLLNLHNQMLKQSLEKEKHSFNLWSGRVHDYKNHMIYMLELLETKDYEKLKKFMEEETDILKHQLRYIKSGYKSIDAIVNFKMEYAKSLDIHMFCNVSIPTGLLLDGTALITILSNLLDNAIRAELPLHEKFIEIHIKYSKGNVYIKVVNHKEAREIDFETSDKKEAEWHGVGLRSVKQQIKKLNGDFKLIQELNKVTAIAVIYEVEKCIG